MDQPLTAVGTRPARAARRAAWLFGVLLLSAVVVVALHVSEWREFTRLAERANPWWVLLAVALQVATYLAQAEVFRAAPHAAGVSLPRSWLWQLSLTKLFVDQALPSAGLGSTVVVTKALEQRGVPRDIAAAGALVNIASYHAAYVIVLLAALGIIGVQGRTSVFVLGVSLLFIAFAVGLTVVVLALAGRPESSAHALGRVPVLRGAVRFLGAANRSVVRSPRLLVHAGLWQAVIFLLDAATMWTLVEAVGATAPASSVFAGFMTASVFRTVGIVPGGLGTFEAMSVLTLHTFGLEVPVALTATLLFRGLSFWLPMLPGLWASRRVVARVPDTAVHRTPDAYWAMDLGDLAARLGSGSDGLTQAEAATRLQDVGPNRLRAQGAVSRLRAVSAQLRSPLLLLLVFAALASAIGGEWIDAAIVLVIVVASVGISASREYSAHSAVAALQAQVRTRTTAVRGGEAVDVPVEEIVPGDVVLLSAGSLVPGDAVVLEATDFFVSEAMLTGESFPVEKRPSVVPGDALLVQRVNCVYFGTNVRSGTGRCLVVHTGTATEYGAVAHRLTLRPPETEFDRGLRRFGYLLTSAMLALVFVVFAAHMLLGREVVEALLFSVALAVGLSPELLPAILSVNLARGAQMMARRGVMVRRLNAIENLGSMDILCTDKTGTITQGVVQLEGAYDPLGAPSPDVLELGALNAALETGLHNPLDEAILSSHTAALAGVRKLAEVPFDFIRKRVSVIVEQGATVLLVTKGAFDHVLEVCTQVSDGRPLDADVRAGLEDLYRQWTGRGIRVLAVATRSLTPQPGYGRADEQALTLSGFLTFMDRPKPGVAEALVSLSALGVATKLITGDSRLVAQHVARAVGLRAERVLTGEEIQGLHDEALWHMAERTDLFVEVDPNQKERIILALKKTGHVVGFLGDGVNDAPAMHAADTSLSVESAVDVAREAADFVLLERDLDVIRQGVEEGRKTFANTMKYVLTTTSANLGNMVSMAVASLFLPFLPLLAGQILLNNFLSDIPAVGLADDAVDPEMVERPERWSMGFIGRFMVTFGLLSSVFDGLIFVVLLGGFHASPAVFRTAWFVESLLTELVVALLVRTRRLFFRSRPGRLLVGSTAALAVVAMAIPYAPFADLLEFVPLSAPIAGTICIVAALYAAATELAKRWFYGATASSRRAR